MPEKVAMPPIVDEEEMEKIVGVSSSAMAPTPREYTSIFKKPVRKAKTTMTLKRPASSLKRPASCLAPTIEIEQSDEHDLDAIVESYMPVYGTIEDTKLAARVYSAVWHKMHDKYKHLGDQEAKAYASRLARSASARWKSWVRGGHEMVSMHGMH